MKLTLCLFIIMVPLKGLWASHIFHLDKQQGVCKWKLYDVKKQKDKTYYRTQACPNQIVWLKDKSFYYSIGSKIYWSSQWSKKPQYVVNLKTARKGYDPTSEVIWGVKGKYNSIHAMVIDPNLKHMRINKEESYEFRKKPVDGSTFSGVATEPRAAGVIRTWQKSGAWKTQLVKVVGRYNERHYDEDLYNMSVLSSRQIVHYNECAGDNCEKLPSESFWSLNKYQKKLKVIDNGIESMGYLSLDEDKGLLFKKSLQDHLQTIKPFILCEDNCDKMTELELPKSFSDSYAMVKKGNHFLISNENRGSIAGLYSFDSPKPIKEFRGPMVFWHPF